MVSFYSYPVINKIWTEKQPNFFFSYKVKPYKFVYMFYADLYDLLKLNLSSDG